MRPEKPKRYWRNYLLDPSFQIKYVLYFLSLGLMIWGVGVSLLLLKFNQFRVWLITENFANSQILSQMNILTNDVTAIVVVVLLVYWFLAFFLALYVTHRVVGPMVAIRQYIKALKNGDYDAVRTLRKYDELVPIMDDLKELSSKLKSHN